MKKIENTLAFVECFFKNRFTRLISILIFITIFNFILGYYILGIIYLVIAVLTLFMVNFGCNFYIMYKRSMNHMINYRKIIHSGSYCGNIGCEVAERRFRKKHPEEYQEIKKKEFENNLSHFEKIMILIINNE